MGILRVMMLSTDLQRGGLPLRLVKLARCLRSFDVEPIVGCLAPRGPLNDLLESSGIETFACNAAGPFDVRCFGRFAEHARRIDPDLIHSSLFHANLVARLLGRIDRPRPILTSTVTIEIERRWHRWIEAITSNLSDLHVANSQAVGRHVVADLGFSSDRLLVIPNGLDLSEVDSVETPSRHDYGIEDKCPLIVWAGRMDPVKNLETFVEIIAGVYCNVQVRALLLGDGPELPKIRTIVKNKNLEKVIHFAGWSENVTGWLKAADLLLFPSWTEGSPNVVLEAMACRCPVVAARIAACEELIASGRSGILCSPGDVEGFVRSVFTMLADAEMRRSYADVAHQRVTARHSIQDVVVQWRAAYDRLMSAM